MEDIPLLRDIVVIFGLSIVVLLLMHRFHLPAIVGFLFTGVLCGPYALGLIKAQANVQVLANIGIILLLFIVGMEFSFKKILEYRSYFFIGGALQVGLTVLAGMAVGMGLGRPWGEALFLGFLLSLSSTAIVLRMLSDRTESDSPHGKVIVGMMIFQDIIAIPMMLTIPLLCGNCLKYDISLVWALLKGVGILAGVLFSAIKLVPLLLYRIAKTGSRELFLLSVFTICLSVAWVTSSIGLSLSLGAFLAGLIISDSEYRTEAIGDILPFKDIFTSFFFVSIGMLLDIGFVAAQPLTILALTAGILLLKMFTAGFATFLLGMPLRTVILTAIAMSQVGEFSFVLARVGFTEHLGSNYHYQLFLAVAVLTMAMTPSMMAWSPWVAQQFLRLPLPNWIKFGFKPLPITKPVDGFKNHVIIVGFGISGRNLARSSKEAAIPYVILEMNPETVRQEKMKGEPINFGDATHDLVLKHANIHEAKVLAVVINDPIASSRIVESARKLNKKLYIVVRTRYLREMRPMYELGADEVIPDEFGSSVEVFTRVLRTYHVPTDQVEKIISGMRIEGYEMLRLLYKEPSTLSDLQVSMSDVLIETLKVEEGAPIIGKTLVEIELRGRYGVTAMLIKRGSETITNVEAKTRILHNDVVVLVGTHDNLSRASELFKPQRVDASSG